MKTLLTYCCLLSPLSESGISLLKPLKYNIQSPQIMEFSANMDITHRLY